MKLAVTVFLVCLSAWGQTERGNITGSVTDATGAAVPGATVAITNLATNQNVTVTSTGAGDFNGANLPPGNYRIEFSAVGFKRTVHDNVVLTASATVRVDGRLELGQVNETVEVKAEVAQIQTENSKITTAVQNKLVDELPGRRPAQSLRSCVDHA
jgi:Carboxypeptidase regulatory-like domain